MNSANKLISELKFIGKVKPKQKICVTNNNQSQSMSVNLLPPPTSFLPSYMTHERYVIPYHSPAITYDDHYMLRSGRTRFLDLIHMPSKSDCTWHFLHQTTLCSCCWLTGTVN